jgi:hypothetical protein
LVKEIQVGATEILTTGIRVILAVRTGSPGHVAYTVTVFMAVIVEGAVYEPDWVI